MLYNLGSHGYPTNETNMEYTVKPATKKEYKNLAFNADNRLMQVKGIAECPNGSIMQYFRPSLSYHLTLRSFLSIFEWPLKAGFTVHCLAHPLNVIQPIESSYTTHRIKLHCTKLIMCMYLPLCGGGGALFFV